MSIVKSILEGVGVLMILSFGFGALTEQKQIPIGGDFGVYGGSHDYIQLDTRVSDFKNISVGLACNINTRGGGIVDMDFKGGRCNEKIVISCGASPIDGDPCKAPTAMPDSTVINYFAIDLRGPWAEYYNLKYPCPNGEKILRNGEVCRGDQNGVRFIDPDNKINDKLNTKFELESSGFFARVIHFFNLFKNGGTMAPLRFRKIL